MAEQQSQTRITKHNNPGHVLQEHIFQGASSLRHSPSLSLKTKMPFSEGMHHKNKAKNM